MQLANPGWNIPISIDHPSQLVAIKADGKTIYAGGADAIPPNMINVEVPLDAWTKMRSSLAGAKTLTFQLGPDIVTPVAFSVTGTQQALRQFEACTRGKGKRPLSRSRNP
jgi:hypothetical protein